MILYLLREPILASFWRKTMSKKIIGICGHAGSGKDTIALKLAEFGVVRVAFADKLKAVVSAIYGVPLEAFHDRELKNKLDKRLSSGYLEGSADPGALRTLLEHVFRELFGDLRYIDHAERIFFSLLPDGGCTPREAAQLIGTEGFRVVHDTVWVDYAIRQAVEMASAGKTVAITDVRFENEAAAVRNAGGIVLGVSRLSCEKYDHDSERKVSEIVENSDYLIDNNGTLDELMEKVVDFNLDYRSFFHGSLSKFDLIRENRVLMSALAEARDVFDYCNEMIPAIGDPPEVPRFIKERVAELRATTAEKCSV